MLQIGTKKFKEVWVVDFEFYSPDGERQTPICMVAVELQSGNRLTFWQDELYEMKSPPFSTGNTALFVAYYASAEFGCFLSLGWPLPENVLDLFVEFRVKTNGSNIPCGSGLLGALVCHGIGNIGAVEKDSLRQLAIRGGPWTTGERHALLAYCESDVKALSQLLSAMVSSIDLPRALLRGRYMKAAAQIEFNGVPIDTAYLLRLREHWLMIQEELIRQIDSEYNVYEGRTFKMDRFTRYLISKNISWPLLESGKPDLKDDTFREMSQVCPEIQPLRELRVALSQMRLSKLAVGTDGRNRCLTSAFRARTGRNQPSTSKFIFGPAVWLRSLIRPEPGYGLAYVDWSQQEFGIAAALSGDVAMLEAYRTKDPYLAFAKQAGAAPADATKATHGDVRNQFKACVLAVQYGMGPEALAKKINVAVIVARQLLSLHRETYNTFWGWSNGVVDYAMLHGKLWTTFGWTLHVGPNANPRSLRNFPMQANGAEMLRIACCLATERGVRVCAPIHDAVLIEAPLDELDKCVKLTQAAMAEASALVLDGFELSTDVNVIRYPDRYSDKRGKVMWDTVYSILHQQTCINLNQVGMSN